MRVSSRRHSLAPYLFVGPFLVVFAAMLIVPLCYALYLSLFQTRLVGGTVFVGLANYLDAFRDAKLREGVLRMVEFLALQVPPMLVLSVLFALALDSGRLRFARAIRLGIFLPYAIPSVVAALMWGYLYGPDFGPFAQLANAVGLPKPQFLTSTWMLGSLANIVSWEFIGYNMIILFAALRTVSPELYDAAAVDGASAWRIAWHIKLPSIRPALLLVGLFSVIGTFQLFNEPRVMLTITPTVIGSFYTPNLYAYTLAFTNREVNYSAAVSFVLGFVILVLSYAFILATSRRSRS
jgi:multiple sugar transport system permease protein